jgi:hypothetical protein
MPAVSLCMKSGILPRRRPPGTSLACKQFLALQGSGRTPQRAGTCDELA